MSGMLSPILFSPRLYLMNLQSICIDQSGRCLYRQKSSMIASTSTCDNLFFTHLIPVFFVETISDETSLIAEVDTLRLMIMPIFSLLFFFYLRYERVTSNTQSIYFLNHCFSYLFIRKCILWDLVMEYRR